jgi:hypothetical protein
MSNSREEELLAMTLARYVHDLQYENLPRRLSSKQSSRYWMLWGI